MSLAIPPSRWDHTPREKYLSAEQEAAFAELPSPVQQLLFELAKCRLTAQTETYPFALSNSELDMLDRSPVTRWVKKQVRWERALFEACWAATGTTEPAPTRLWQAALTPLTDAADHAGPATAQTLLQAREYERAAMALARHFKGFTPDEPLSR